MGFKNAILTAGIGVLGTIAAGGLRPLNIAIDNLTAAQPVGVVAYAPPVESSAWATAMWWAAPSALFLTIVCVAAYVFAKVYVMVKYPAKLSVAAAKRAEGVYAEEKEYKAKQKEHKSLQVGNLLRAAEEREAKEMARYTTEQPAVEQMPAAITLQQAINQSTERAWIIGQAADIQPTPEASKLAGQMLMFDYRTTHAAIIGGTGSGKTESTAMLMVAYARKYNLHPIVLDGKEGIDWRAFNGVAEWHAMSVGTVVNQFDQLMTIFDRRWGWLQKNNLSTIYKATGKRPPTLFVIIEEFGSVWMTLDKAARADLAQKVDRLFRLGRATGIVLCLIDQAPEKWTAQMRGNAKFVTCYKLKGMVANAFNEYHVDRLPHVGVFSQDNVFYNAWHTAELIDIRREYPPLQWRCLKTPVETINDTEAPVNDGENDRLQVVETPVNAINAGGVSVDFLPIPPSLERSFMRLRCWESFCKGYLSIYPETTQAQLRKAMSNLDGRDPDTFKTEAFKWFHMYSLQGDKSKIAGKFGFSDSIPKGMKLVA